MPGRSDVNSGTPCPCAALKRPRAERCRRSPSARFLGIYEGTGPGPGVFGWSSSVRVVRIVWREAGQTVLQRGGTSIDCDRDSGNVMEADEAFESESTSRR